MHARVTTIQVPPDKMEETISIYRDSVAPAARQQEGCQGVYLLTDRDTGRGISITFWDSEASMMWGESSGYYQKQFDKFKGVWSEPPVREAYQVIVQG